MELHQLNLVMRNSVEIHNLIKVTMDLLQKQKTVFIHQETKKIENEAKTDIPMPKSKHANELSKLASDTSRELPSRKRDPLDYHEESSSIPTLGLDEAQAVSESVWETGDGVTTTTRNFLKTAARGFSFRGNKTTSKFHYAAVDKTGHNISLSFVK